MDIDLEKMANGKLGVKKENLWNSAGTWPDDVNDKKQNPYGRPRIFFCPTIDKQCIAWEGKVGFLTKERALEIGALFQAKCRELLAEGYSTS